MFIKPETDPEEPEAISAETDQKALCERYSAPAPPARMTLATRAFAAREPSTRKIVVSPRPRNAMLARPIRFPYRRVSASLMAPPSGLQMAMARKGKVV